MQHTVARPLTRHGSQHTPPLSRTAIAVCWFSQQRSPAFRFDIGWTRPSATKRPKPGNSN